MFKNIFIIKNFISLLLIFNTLNSCILLKKTKECKIIKSYNVKIIEDNKASNVILNIQIFKNDEIFVKIKRFGLLLYKKYFNENKYYKSEIFNELGLKYKDLIFVFSINKGIQNIQTDSFDICVDNNQNKISLFVKNKNFLKIPID